MTDAIRSDVANMAIALEMRNVALQAANQIVIQNTEYWQRRATESELRLERHWRRRRTRGTIAVLYGLACAMAAISGWCR